MWSTWSPASRQPCNTQILLRVGNSWELFVPWGMLDHCWVTTFWALSCTKKIFVSFVRASSAALATHTTSTVASANKHRNKKMEKHLYKRAEHFDAVAERASPFCCSAAQAVLARFYSEPLLGLLLLPFCHENHDGGDEKKAKTKITASASTWSLWWGEHWSSRRAPQARS